MIDEEAISVVITAAKETVDPLLEEASHSHGPSHMQYHQPLSLVRSTSLPSSSKHKYTMYTVFVRNRQSGSKFVVRRRYSDFFKLRRELMEFVSWGHCAFCDQYLHQIAEYPFPRRRLLRSNLATVVKERMDSLGLFLRHLLLCIMARSFEGCPQASAKIENCVLKSFLQVDHISALFPKLTGSKQQAPVEFMHAIEEKRHQQQNVRAAVLRSRSMGNTAPMEHLETVMPRQVAANTCPQCLQKWTFCYCNEQQDSVYPVNMHALQRLQDEPPYQHPFYSQNERGHDEVDHVALQLQQQHLHAPPHPTQQSRGSCSSQESESSRCSRCERGWDHCYCCQQVSPTVSSACNDL